FILIYSFLISTPVFSQTLGNLLLVKVEKDRNLKIDKQKIFLHAVELDTNNIPLKNTTSKLIISEGYTDQHILECINKDSIHLKTFRSSDNFIYNGGFGYNNLDIINLYSKEFKELIELKINSKVYKEKIKVSYLFISCKYCIGNMAKKDGEMIGYQGEIILLMDKLKVDSKFELDTDEMYDVIKSLNLNDFIY
uniref:hypothetical protein n=1 Tax=Flavobacterium sp. TaxID=239 RepID=UPI00263A2A50